MAGPPLCTAEGHELRAAGAAGAGVAPAAALAYGAVRITREFIEATGIVCGRPQPIFNLDETDIE